MIQFNAGQLEGITVMFCTKKTQKYLTKSWIMLYFSTSSVPFVMPDHDGLTHVWTVKWPEQVSGGQA